ncbi:MAG TPA: LysE family translocator [Rhizomicrobium sp.]|nr:LysE family translocator [Rhizomicrobium sp.]
MTIDQALAFALFAFAVSITPGPNNTLVLASGANFGFRATIPQLLGIDIGFALMIVAVGMGIGGLFAAFPSLHTALRFVGVLYLLYLAWKIASSTGIESGRREAPMTFLEAAAFQWVNPKGWIAALGTVATFTPSHGYFLNLIAVTAIFALVMGPCISLWAAVGTAVRTLLTERSRLRAFNIVMGLLLVASLYPTLAAA